MAVKLLVAVVVAFSLMRKLLELLPGFVVFIELRSRRPERRHVKLPPPCGRRTPLIQQMLTPSGAAATGAHFSRFFLGQTTISLPPFRSKKGSPYSITERRVPVLGSQPAGDVNHKPGGKLPLLSVRPTVTPATLKRTAISFAAW